MWLASEELIHFPAVVQVTSEHERQNFFCELSYPIDARMGTVNRQFLVFFDGSPSYPLDAQFLKNIKVILFLANRMGKLKHANLG